MTKKIKKVTIIKSGAAPDVDTDISTSRRQEVIDYVTNKYGSDKVSNIITFGKFKTKESLKSIGKIYGIPFQQMNTFTQKIPAPIDGKECEVKDVFYPTGKRYIEGESFRDEIDKNKALEKVVVKSEKILDRVRNEGVHACFTGDTLVNTPDGYKKIKKIVIGDKVLTHLNRYKKVVDVIVTNHKKGYKIKSANGLTLKVTEKHPFYVLNKNTKEISWKKASELTVDDYLGTPLNKKNKKIKNFIKRNNLWYSIGAYVAGDNSLLEENLLYDEFLIPFDGGEIPDFVLDLPKENLQEFLKGYCEYTGDNLEDYFIVEKKRTVLGITKIINKLYNKSLNTIKIVDAYLCYIKADEKEKSIVYSDYIWSPLVQKEEYTIEEETYNLTVLDDSSYEVENTIVHNCGVIISSEKLTNTIPIQVRQEDNIVVTQWDYPSCEALGLIKMDFLGLDTVDIIDNAVKNIKETKGIDIDIEKLQFGDLNDEKTFKLFQEGKTSSIFQFSGAGVQNLLRSMKPTVFDDLAATTALYRPGPMGMGSHTSYSNRKNGEEEQVPVHKDFYGTVVEEILKPTFGLIVYQESVMRIATRAAGFTSVEADGLRKAIGKKKMDLMRSMKPKFINGILANLKVSEEAANILWNTIEEQGKYSFNKSHSVSYALNAYTAAYLKANYTKEYMASILEQSVGARDKHLEYMQDAKKMNLKLGGIDINKSQDRIVALKDEEDIDIQYGFNSIKGITQETLTELMKARKQGEFKDFYDFLLRIENLKEAQLKLLAQAGAFDCFNISRKSIVDNAKRLLTNAKIDKNTSSVGLFAMMSTSVQPTSLKNIHLDEEEYDLIEKARIEADLLGTFITTHPLDNINKKGVYVDLLSEPSKLNYKEAIVTFSSVEEKNFKTFSIVNVVADSKINNNNFRMSRNVINALMKARLLKSKKELTFEQQEIVDNPYIKPIEEIKTNYPYLVKFKAPYIPNNKGEISSVQIDSIEEIILGKNGKEPIVVQLKIKDIPDISVIEKYVKSKIKEKGEHYLFIKNEDELYKTDIKLPYTQETYIALSQLKSPKGSLIFNTIDEGMI